MPQARSPQLAERRSGGAPRLGEQCADRFRIAVEVPPHQAELHVQGHQPGLRSVVQVTLDAAQFGLLSLDDTGAAGR